jgi:hypothetical protein
MGLFQQGIAQQSGDTRIDFENLAREALQKNNKKKVDGRMTLWESS